MHRRRVIVAVFENRTGDPRLDPIGDMVVDWVTRSILQTGLVEVVDPRVLFTRGRTPQGSPWNRSHWRAATARVRSSPAATIALATASCSLPRSLMSLPPTSSGASVPLAAALGASGRRGRCHALARARVTRVDARSAFRRALERGVPPPPFEAYSPYVAGCDRILVRSTPSAPNPCSRWPRRSTRHSTPRRLAELATAAGARRLRDRRLDRTLRRVSTARPRPRSTD